MPKTVLVVDDHPATVELVSLWLETSGYRALKAYGGNQALDIIGREKPDLVLSDINMPIIDGYEVLRQARHGGYKGPFVFMSTKDQKDAGCNDADGYLTKPFLTDDLKKAVESALIGEAGETGIR
ncbi:MAG TPA: response regulator [archaeon]|nr:response regulator [archaeon]